MIIPNREQKIEKSLNKEILYDLLSKKDRTKCNYDICIYLLPESKIETQNNETTKIEKSVECNKCTYLNNILNDQCEICLNILAQNRTTNTETNFDCSLCLDKSLRIETGINLHKCGHSFCKYK